MSAAFRLAASVIINHVSDADPIIGGPAPRPSVRRGQIVWLTLILAIVTLVVLTSITTNAGEWLYDLRRHPDPILQQLQRPRAGSWLSAPAAQQV